MRRWITLLGRGGTVLIAIALALLLVSFIPATSGTKSMSSGPIRPGRWNSWYYEGVLTPQQTLRLSVTANGTLDVYLLEVNSQTIYTWINEHHPDHIDVENIPYLEEYLEASPESIAWQNEISDTKIEYEYVPTKITNATLVLSNPTSYLVQIEFEGSVTAQIAPRGKVRTLAQWAIPIGFVLALPWGINFLKTRTKRIHASG